MKGRNILLVVICLLTTTAGGILTFRRTYQEPDLEAVMEIWGDVIRDLDQVGKTVTRVSAKREMEIGRQIEKELGRSGEITQDALQDYVVTVGQVLLKHTQRNNIQYRFYILDSPLINAFALPGGGIFITTGMLDFLESEAELAAILGHEISHVDLRHCIDRLQYELVARKIGGNDLAAITRVGYILVGLPFSKQQELEADAAGAILAAQARYDPQAAVAVFERLAKSDAQRRGDGRDHRGKPTSMTRELGDALSKAPEQYFATHPAMETRIRELNQLYNRNARAWQGEKFYVGHSNYQDRIPRSSSERPAEWRS